MTQTGTCGRAVARTHMDRIFFLLEQRNERLIVLLLVLTLVWGGWRWAAACAIAVCKNGNDNGNDDNGNEHARVHGTGVSMLYTKARHVAKGVSVGHGAVDDALHAGRVFVRAVPVEHVPLETVRGMQVGGGAVGHGDAIPLDRDSLAIERREDPSSEVHVEEEPEGRRGVAGDLLERVEGHVVDLGHIAGVGEGAVEELARTFEKLDTRLVEVHGRADAELHAGMQSLLAAEELPPEDVKWRFGLV